MNLRIKELALQAKEYSVSEYSKWIPPANSYEGVPSIRELYTEKFAELIVEECRNVLSEVYRETPLECCGHLLHADEKIAQHFYLDEK